MGLLKNQMLSSLWCLAAAVTLVAASPYFGCRCSSVQAARCHADGTPCSCGDKCSTSERRSCCKNNEATEDSSTGSDQHLTCTKRPTGTDDSTAPSKASAPVKELVAGWLLPSVTSAINPVLDDGFPVRWESYCEPPPTDLVVLLQHFLI